jgi:hypothetical protein
MSVKLARRPMLASVVKGVMQIPDRVLLHGIPGVGKSTFGSGFPNPVFAETDREGSARIDTSRTQIETWQDMNDLVEDLIESEHDYKTLVVDTLDALEGMLWSFMCERDKKDSIESYGYGKGYVAAVEEWRLFISRLERLRNAKRMGIVFIAHTNLNKFSNPEADDFDRYEMKLHKRAAALFSEWCDCILFARFEVLVAKDEKNGRARGVQTGNRVLHTVRSAAYDAKNRYGLPETIPLDYQSFAAGVERGTPREATEVKTSIVKILVDLNDERITAKVNADLASAGENANELLRIENRLKATLSQKAGK